MIIIMIMIIILFVISINTKQGKKDYYYCGNPLSLY